jgi:hypothetical protein
MRSVSTCPATSCKSPAAYGFIEDKLGHDFLHHATARAAGLEFLRQVTGCETKGQQLPQAWSVEIADYAYNPMSIVCFENASNVSDEAWTSSAMGLRGALEL